MEEKNKQRLDRIKTIARTYTYGLITYSRACEVAKRDIDEINLAAKKIAKEQGVRARYITLRNFIR